MSKYYLHKGNVVDLTNAKRQEIIKEVEMMSLKGLRCLGAGRLLFFHKPYHQNKLL